MLSYHPTATRGGRGFVSRIFSPPLLFPPPRLFSWLLAQRTLAIVRLRRVESNEKKLTGSSANVCRGLQRPSGSTGGTHSAAGLSVFLSLFFKFLAPKSFFSFGATLVREKKKQQGAEEKKNIRWKKKWRCQTGRGREQPREWRRRRCGRWWWWWRWRLRRAGTTTVLFISHSISSHSLVLPWDPRRTAVSGLQLLFPLTGSEREREREV